MTQEHSSPPTTLLHDAWGSPRQLSDAEIRKANQRLFWLDLARIAVLGLLSLGVLALLVWVLLLASRL